MGRRHLSCGSHAHSRHRCVGLRRHCPLPRAARARPHGPRRREAADTAGRGPAPVGTDPHPGYRCRIRSQRARRRRWNDRPPCRDRPPIEPHRGGDSAVRLAEAAAGIVGRFIFLSSVKVHGEDSGNGTYGEDDALDPRDSYGRSKLEAERALTETTARNGMELVLIRPPLVYGPEVKANFLRLLGWADSGLPLPFASVRNRRSLIYVGNLVDAIARCAEHPAARGPFLVSDDETVSTPELVSRITRALERPARLIPVPPALLRAAGMIAGRRDEIQRLIGNLAIDSSKARRLLDWRPPYALDEGLAETARWFKSARD